MTSKYDTFTAATKRIALPVASFLNEIIVI